MTLKKVFPNKGGKRRPVLYSDSFKVQIALEYLDGEYSTYQVGARNHLPKWTVQYFVSWYRQHYPVIVMPQEVSIPEEINLPAGSAKELKKKLALAEMKIAALEKVIALANETYNTDLKKKAATK